MQLAIQLLLIAMQSGPPLPFIDVCTVIHNPKRYSGQSIRVIGSIRASMHGTHLVDKKDCDGNIFLVLPSELREPVGLSDPKAAPAFERFLQARANHQPGAPAVTMLLEGHLQFKKRGRAFGYDGRNRLRLIVQSVEDVPGS